MKLHSALIQEKFLLGGDHSIINKNMPIVGSSETTIKSYKKMRDLVEFNAA
jgi:hypothetical protein